MSSQSLFLSSKYGKAIEFFGEVKYLKCLGNESERVFETFQNRF